MKLELSSQQKTILSQRMQLSVKILQMSNTELTEYIQEMSLENPLIELTPPQETEDEVKKSIEKLEWLRRMERSEHPGYTGHSDYDDRDTRFNQKPPADSLTGVLLMQLPGFHLSPQEEQGLRYIIRSLDSSGYLPVSREQLCQEMSLCPAQVERLLSVLHSMEPHGVGAENLRECLLIQAQLLEDKNGLLIEIIENHLELLAKNQLGKLSGILGASLQEIHNAKSLLLTLNPKPGNGYGEGEPIPYVHPDIFIIKKDGDFQAVFNDLRHPHIEINSYYCNIAYSQGGEAAEYINKQRGKAEWLQSSVMQRKTTIMKCLQSIISRQRSFFELGPGNLSPMTLSDVAEDIDSHLSTVSRAVSGKYLQCHWGVFGLGELFAHGVTGGEDSLSQDRIQLHIRKIISGEDPGRPHSDQAISRLLEEEGISVARRTVAKYRDQMGIPNAGGRKQF